jgi:hypothetical protein
VSDGGTRPGGYTIVLPPGWRRIPLRQGPEETEKAARAAVSASLRALPRGVPRDRLAAFRAESEGRLRTMAAQVRKQGGVDLYLPVESMRGIPVSASFVVSEGSLGGGGGAAPVDPAQVVTYLAAERGDGKRTQAALDGALALRVEHVAGPDPAADVQATTRRVDYIVSMPGEPDRWLVVAFSTLDQSGQSQDSQSQDSQSQDSQSQDSQGSQSAHNGAAANAADDGQETAGPGDQLAHLLVQLFDAMMATFRWTWTPDG